MVTIPEAFQSMAVVVRRPFIREQGWRRQSGCLERLAEDRLEIVAVPTPASKEGLYEGRRVKPGHVYLHVREARRQPAPQYASHQVLKNGWLRTLYYKVFDPAVKPETPKSYLVHVEHQFRFANRPAQLEGPQFVENLRRMVSQSLRQVVDSLMSASLSHGFFDNGESYRRSNFNPDQEALMRQKFLGMLKSGKTAFILWREPNSIPTPESPRPTESGRRKRIVRSDHRRRYDGQPEEARQASAVHRVIDPRRGRVKISPKRITKSLDSEREAIRKKKPKWRLKQEAKVARRRLDVILSQEGIQEHHEES